MPYNGELLYVGDNKTIDAMLDCDDNVEQLRRKLIGLLDIRLLVESLPISHSRQEVVRWLLWGVEKHILNIIEEVR